MVSLSNHRWGGQASFDKLRMRDTGGGWGYFAIVLDPALTALERTPPLYYNMFTCALQ